MTFRYRCNKRIDGVTCGGRKTLKKQIEFFAKEPKCPNCKNATLRLDKWRMKNEVNGNGDTCNCDGYHFPHRKGSMWCRETTSPPTDEDYRDRYNAY